jgi:hypothetical protein
MSQARSLSSAAADKPLHEWSALDMQTEIRRGGQVFDVMIGSAAGLGHVQTVLRLQERDLSDLSRVAAHVYQRMVLSYIADHRGEPAAMTQAVSRAF